MGFGSEFCFCKWQWRIRALSCRSPVGRSWGVRLERSRAISMSNSPPMQSSVPGSLKEVCSFHYHWICFKSLYPNSDLVLLQFLIVQRWMELTEFSDVLSQRFHICLMPPLLQKHIHWSLFFIPYSQFKLSQLTCVLNLFNGHKKNITSTAAYKLVHNIFNFES